MRAVKSVSIDSDRRVIITYLDGSTETLFPEQIDYDEAIRLLNEQVDGLNEDVGELKENLTDLRELADTKAPAIYGRASGAIASFSDGADDLPMKSLVCNIEPVQDLHGYDNPWPGGGGKNKFDEEMEFGGISSSDGSDYSSNDTLRAKNYIPVTAGEKYYFLCPINVTRCFYDKNKRWISTGYAGNEEITAPANAHYFRFSLPPSYGTTYNHDIAINYPSSVTTYSPYSNICPISGRTGLKLWRTGKNLFWKARQSSTINGITWTLNDDGSITASGTSTGRSYIRIIVYDRDSYTLPKKGTYTYSLTPTGSDYANIRSLIGSYKGGNYYKNVCHVLKSNNFANVFVWNDSDLTAVLDIFVDIPEANKTVNCTVYPQLELGSTATAYEPYQGNTYSVNWETEAGTVYGGYVDVVSGKLTVGWAIANVTIGNDNGVTGGNQLMAFTAPGKKGGLTNFVSNLFGTGSGSYMMTGRSSTEVVEFRVPLDALNVSASDSAATRMAAFAKWLLNNPTQLCYELATPTEIQLTPQEISTLLGENNIWSDGGDVEVEYPADTKMYIDTKIAEAVAAAMA